MSLSKRLKAVVDMVPAGVTPADNGCDHGYVAIALIREGKCKSVIASDINKGPLKRAEEHIKEAGLSDVIDLRLSDGVKEIRDGEVDTLIISGMGGLLIRDILKNAFEKMKDHLNDLILLPHRDIDIVRVFLRKNGFVIEDEEMVFEDNKYYTVIHAVKSDRYGGADIAYLSDKSFDEEVNDMFGPVLLMKRSDVFISYLMHEKAKANDLVTKVTDERKIRELKERIRIIDEVIS